jgi:hypothetical protein
MALRSTQFLTEMSTRNLPGGKGPPADMADDLTAVCEPTVYEMLGPRRLTTLSASTPVTRIALPFIYLFLLKTMFQRLDSVSSLRQKPEQLGPIEKDGPSLQVMIFQVP